ncbi:RNA 2',3'-cyclic phosphodiesterase [Blastococcus sp. SYSU D00820]
MSAPPSLRLFLAVTPPAGAVGHLAGALAVVRGAPGEPRWVAPERWHLTLLFLGAVLPEVVGELGAAAGAAVAAAPPMRLRLAGAGRFGSQRRPAVLWAGVEGDVEPLNALAGRLAGAARGLGLPVEDRPFRAHLTLGRWRPGRPADGALAERLAGYRGPEWPVREVQLLRSTLGAAPRYDRLAGWAVG